MLCTYKVLSIQEDGGLLIFILALTQDSQSDSLRGRKKGHVFIYHLDIYWARQNELSNSVDI